MKTNFNNQNTERISWITLMNRNGYIISLLFLLCIITGAVITESENTGLLNLLAGLSPVIAGAACIVWFGFYQFWKTFNKSYGWKVHTVMKGKHYSTFFRLPWIFKTKQSRVFMFAPECAQATNDDINKLYRIGFNWLPFKWNGSNKWEPAHHFNSIGFGWRGNGIAIEIFTYTYQAGQRKADLITVIPVATPFSFDLDNIDNKVLYSVVPLEIGSTTPISHRSTHKWPDTEFGYKLGFYVGGDEPADRNYQVWEKR